MKRTLVTVTLSLFSVALLGGCGGDKEENTSTWSGGSSAAPATKPAADPAATTKAAVKPASDAAICKAVDKAAKGMVKAVIVDSSPGGMKNAVADFGATLTKLAAQAGDGKTGAALQDLNKVVTEAQSAADPTAALDGPEWNKAGKTLETQCKAAGVNINFS